VDRQTLRVLFIYTFYFILCCLGIPSDDDTFYNLGRLELLVRVGDGAVSVFGCGAIDPVCRATAVQ
jgi:hypothetical protein